MKKTFLILMLSLVAAGALMMTSCKKEDQTNNNGNQTEGEATIIGHWRLDHAIQKDEYNEVDYGMILGGEKFQLTFKEDGTLITSNGTYDSEMQYEYDGDHVSFIQVPGQPGIVYDILELTPTKLTLQNGEIATGQTTMWFVRVND